LRKSNAPICARSNTRNFSTRTAATTASPGAWRCARGGWR